MYCRFSLRILDLRPAFFVCRVGDTCPNRIGSEAPKSMLCTQDTLWLLPETGSKSSKKCWNCLVVLLVFRFRASQPIPDRVGYSRKKEIETWKRNQTATGDASFKVWFKKVSHWLNKKCCHGNLIWSCMALDRLNPAGLESAGGPRCCGCASASARDIASAAPSVWMRLITSRELRLWQRLISIYSAS